MADFEADIPEQIQNLLHDFGGVGRDLAGVLPVHEHNIDVAKRIQLAAAVAAERDERERCRRGALVACKPRRRSEDVPQQHIDELNASRTDVTACAARLVLEPKPMLLDAEEFFVEREDVRRAACTGRRELSLGVSEHFLEMTRHRSVTSR